MKRNTLFVAVPAVLLSGLLLTGCGMFRSTKGWEQAKQETPLQIPPALDTPQASEALVIPPPGANQPTANGATASVNGAGGVIVDGFVLSQPVDVVYQKVGQALGQGDIGTVRGHDDANHSYSLMVTAAAQSSSKPGFFGRMFGGGKSSADAPGARPHAVQLSIGSSGTNGSEVRAQGNAGAVAKVIDALKARLGG